MHRYLELSEEGGSAHKFYEARAEGCTLTVRYGRIGTEGQTQVRIFATPEEAQAEAQKKLAEKRRKGYMDAVAGEREKRAVPQPALRLPKALSSYREVLEASVRPYVALKGSPPRPTMSPWTSKLGGVPYRPLGSAWPLASDGQPLAFLAQLNFAELPPLAGFPQQGIVQFFIRDDDFYGANFDGALDMTSLADDANYRVLYHPEVIPDPAGLEQTLPVGVPGSDDSILGLPHDPTLTFELRGELRSGPVTSDDRLFDQLVGQSLWELGDTEDVNADDLSDRYALLAGSGHKLGGYPNFTQHDPRSVDDPHVLLFQLDSDDDLSLMWGDVGIANFFIHPDDLTRADFSRVVFHWDCC
ncbi:hypothetical protein GCM10008955_26740 [Deinococcus malanensis]|uniref:WGR domain-containing protein n=1 Tax=Deinococcus malanensis TaxID=1706855 RepID=A0ABQ2EYI5_9DEIO|nr:DUF1963 domain-containing protein [Deinococcus malanensis]GGK31550.1 hypothetical protein GCM10008955_26740 [Deinococcus malanensis]